MPRVHRAVKAGSLPSDDGSGGVRFWSVVGTPPKKDRPFFIWRRG
jgi:hypothetical protein